MVDRVTLSLFEPVQAHKAVMFAWGHAKNALMAGHRLTLEVGPEKQEPRHVKHYHALINEISQQLGGDLASKDDANLGESDPQFHKTAGQGFHLMAGGLWL